LAKNGSFGFAEGLACGWGKTKRAICGQAIEIQFFFVRWGCFNFFEALQCGSACQSD
jgi:hypothetical protein